ncbi:MAG: hydrolase [Betaproteobacteria bacterium 13_1_40CM_4_64_4]|nr:MAG: hydrolase [Betaproteobacteria bacterium 13_1_40CM_4_64_4]
MAEAGNGYTLQARIPARSAVLEGEVQIADQSRGIVLFAHGSGSSRFSPRNQFVARSLREAGLATLLFDLLTREEEAVDLATRHLRFDIGLLAERLVDASRWIRTKSETRELKIGYFGASTGGGAALVAAAELGDEVGAVVSRGGRPDLAADALARVKSPTLLIVGGLDEPVIRMNEEALARLRCEKQLQIVPGATHLFEEHGALEEVARLAGEWFGRHLQARPETAARLGKGA